MAESSLQSDTSGIVITKILRSVSHRSLAASSIETRTSDNPCRLHGPLNPPETLLHDIDLAELLVNFAIPVPRIGGHALQSKVLPAQAPFHHSVQRELIEAP